MRKPLVLVGLVVIALVVAACTSADDAAPTTTQPTTTTSSTTTATTTVPATTTTPVAQARPGAADLGDSLYAGIGNGGYDVAHYDLNLVIEPDSDSIAGIVTIEATATQALSRFNLDLIGFEVERVTVDGDQAEFTRDDAELVITPNRDLASGSVFTTEIKYSGTHEPFRPEAFNGTETIGWTDGSDGTEYVISEPDASRSWFPVNDHPSDKATFTFSLTVPNDVIAIANGTNTSVVTDIGSDTWQWSMDEPMAPYLATVIVGDYEILTDDTGPVPIRNAFPAGYRVPSDVDLTNDIMDMFIELIGPYPFDEYGIAVVRGFGFALENQSLSVFGPELVFADVIVHELAHQWFGNAVTPADWGDIWLNEGFATYAEFLWTERQFGRDFIETQFRDIRNAINGNANFSPPGSPPANALFNGGVYIRGAMVLHALRLEVGDDAFFETLQTYYQRHRNGTVRTADFIAVAEEVSGGQLDDLFDAWLYEDDIPEFPSG